MTDSLGPADAALVAAEQEIADLREKGNAFVASGDTSDHDEIWDRVFALDTYIAKLAPDSMTGAAAIIPMTKQIGGMCSRRSLR